MRKLAAIIAAALGVAAFAVVPAGTASARTCFTGNLSWSVGPGSGFPPQFATVVLNTADSPAGCEQVLARVLSTGGNTTRSGLIRNPGSATATVKDGTQLARAWVEKQPNGDPPDRRCKQVFPNVEVNFHPCTG